MAKKKKETDPVQEENPVEKKAKRGIRDSGEKKADAERREKLAGKVKEIFLDGAQQDVLRRLNADSVAREMFVALLDRRRNGEHDATGGKEAIAAMSGRIARSPAEIARVIDHVLQRLSAK